MIPGKGSIHELFARQAERAPDFPAVTDPESQLELWRTGST
jgi:non-ribosomal peptide synthetase component F